MSVTSLSESPNFQTQKCWFSDHMNTNGKIALNIGLEHLFSSTMLYNFANLTMQGCHGF